MADPLAYFITFTSYGTWLHGRAEGSVARQPVGQGRVLLAPDHAREAELSERLRDDPYRLDEARRSVALQTICEAVEYRGWKLWAVHVRTNHIHIVVSAPVLPEKVMADLKGWLSRRLRENFGEARDRKRWTQHGSTRWLNTDESLRECLKYVLDEQGDRMAHYDGRLDPSALG